MAPLFNSQYGGKLVVSCSLHPYPIVQRKLLNDHPPLQGHSDYDEERCHAFVCDLTVDPLSTMVPGGIDLASLMFVLSAITPGKIPEVMKNVFDVSAIPDHAHNYYKPIHFTNLMMCTVQG